MLCDGRIRGVGDLSDDRVEVIAEVRRSELAKGSDFCFAKARNERLFLCPSPELTTADSQPRPPT